MLWKKDEQHQGVRHHDNESTQGRRNNPLETPAFRKDDTPLNRKPGGGDFQAHDESRQSKGTFDREDGEVVTKVLGPVGQFVEHVGGITQLSLSFEGKIRAIDLLL